VTPQVLREQLELYIEAVGRVHPDNGADNRARGVEAGEEGSAGGAAHGSGVMVAQYQAFPRQSMQKWRCNGHVFVVPRHVGKACRNDVSQTLPSYA